MQASLSFHFPSTRNQAVGPELSLCISIPFPERRPKTVTNFMYMCTGELPPSDFVQMLTQLGTPASTFQPSGFSLHYATAEAARAEGLVPFSQTAVVHVDMDGLGILEIGSSTTKTIVTGGFLEDEPLTPVESSLVTTSSSSSRNNPNALVAQMKRLSGGTVLCGSVSGVPNTQGSRYYVVLSDLTTPAQLEELGGFTPLGMITGVYGAGSKANMGMGALVSALRNVPVHPRTLVPTKKIELSECSIDVDYQALSHFQSIAGGARLPATRTETAKRKGVISDVPLPRIAGRARGREEMEEETENEQSTGFFQFTAQFPTSRNGVKTTGDGRVVKRRRLEPSDEEMKTAVEMEKFDFFKAQEDAFGNDLAEIQDSLKARLRRKEHRLGKQKAFQRMSSSLAKRKAINEAIQNKISGKTKTKKLNRKY